MNIDLNRHTIPPNGWKFFQAATGWSAPTPVSSTFDQTVDLIIKHRLMNKAITAKHNLSTDFAEVADELMAYTRKRLGIQEDAPVPKQVAPRIGLGQRVAAVGAAVAKIGVGIGTVTECVQGNPVDRALAESRAKICSVCPENGQGDFTRWFTVPLSEAIRKAESKLKEQKLETSLDDKLQVCEACSCPIKLKVHCSLKTIKSHMIPETQKELHKDCWILNEK